MRTPSLLILAPLLALIQGCANTHGTSVLPGLMYYRSDEALAGKFLMLIVHNYNCVSNSTEAANVSEFDLRTERLRKVVDCPFGILSVSDKGGTFGVIHTTGNWFENEPTNAFVYSVRTGQGQELSISSRVLSAILDEDNAYFQVESAPA